MDHIMEILEVEGEERATGMAEVGVETTDEVEIGNKVEVEDKLAEEGEEEEEVEAVDEALAEVGSSGQNSVVC